MRRELDSLLADHPFLQELPGRYHALLAACARNVRFPAEGYLMREGAPADCFYLLRRGRVAIEVHRPDGAAIGIQTIDGGDILGWSWLIPPYRWRFDARALDHVTAFVLDGACLREKCERDHELGYELLKRFAGIVTRRLEATRLQLLDLYGG
ncbi:MAG: cyclic nucleotide-binding domain-containing protein [Elusimicrobia bacterium]|nr:cyclic nucleotide-binding domain-containing protein [Elusimicrobiota bacterium]